MSLSMKQAVRVAVLAVIGVGAGCVPPLEDGNQSDSLGDDVTAQPSQPCLKNALFMGSLLQRLPGQDARGKLRLVAQPIEWGTVTLVSEAPGYQPIAVASYASKYEQHSFFLRALAAGPSTVAAVWPDHLSSVFTSIDVVCGDKDRDEGRRVLNLIVDEKGESLEARVSFFEDQ